ncbi:MAG: hypothetical protein IPL52_16930 [Flavobacteriales bacterium]|nr:hypothetical protein [Flavobacteriales bacterium]
MFIVDAFSRELVSGLCHAELVGRKLGCVHAVQQVVLFGDAFALLDLIAADAAIQSFVSRIVEDAEHPALHPRLLCGTAQGL